MSEHIIDTVIIVGLLIITALLTYFLNKRINKEIKLLEEKTKKIEEMKNDKIRKTKRTTRKHR